MDQMLAIKVRLADFPDIGVTWSADPLEKRRHYYSENMTLTEWCFSYLTEDLWPAPVFRDTQ